MKPALATNALSRHADGIYVCDDCGTSEAMLDFMQNPLPIVCWAIFREETPADDFKDVPGEEAVKVIQTGHMPKLLRLFRERKAGYLEFSALRSEAIRECPGLTRIWEQPFQV